MRAKQAHLSAELRASFKAINIYIDTYDRNKKESAVKKEQNSYKISVIRRKLITLSGMQNHRCCYCGCNTWHPEIIDYTSTNRLQTNRATAEHVNSKSNGGTDCWDNLVMSCAECNHARGSIPVEEFLEEISLQPNIKNSDQIIKEARDKELSFVNNPTIKSEKKRNNLFWWLCFASWVFPESFDYIMNNANDQTPKAVVSGSSTKKKGGALRMNSIRIRFQENRIAA